mgnify:CR=1 FL=1
MINFEHKIVASQETLKPQLAALSRPLVMTNGCFDILHRGHVSYLDQAAQLGNSLLVAVNSDHSIRQLDKGDNRPINPLADRMAVLAALASVGLVIAFDESTPAILISLIRPDHLVKGGDWTPQQIVGADFVLKHGGQVHSIPIRYPRSTTAMIEKIRQ